MLVIGHRGNTRRWLRRQLRCSDGVEIDVVADDGILKSGHLAPKAAPLLLRERIARAIGELRFTPGMRLEELLAMASGVVMLDLKSPVEPATLRASVEAAGMKPSSVYVSTRWHNLSPGLAREGFRVLLSIDSRPARPGEMVASAEADGVAVRFSYLDKGLVDELHSGGYVVAAWTVNTREAACMATRLGVDMVVTDAPCRLREWLGSC